MVDLIIPNVTSEEAEEILSGLRMRHYQKNWTDKALTARIANKVASSATSAFGWSPGYMERSLSPNNAIVVSIKKA